MVIVDPERLRAFVSEICIGLGLGKEDAGVAAEAMVEADLRGVDTHGVFRLPSYAANLRAGVINPKPSLQIVYESTTAAVLDADHGLGFRPARVGMEMAVERGLRLGMGAVAVRNSRHFGMAAVYAELATAADCIGIVLTNTMPLIPAPGGGVPLVGNNPMAVAVPTGGTRPVVLDMAMSVAALGKVRVAAARGEPIPTHWGYDSNGQPTANAQAVLDSGMLASFGGHKGFGLAMIIDLLAGALAGAALGLQADPMGDRTAAGVGHLFIALHLSAFGSAVDFKHRVDARIQEVKSAPQASGSAPAVMPGELEYRLRQERISGGIPLHQTTYERLLELAQELGVPPMLSASS